MTNPSPSPKSAVPFVDLKAQYQSIKPAIDAAIAAVIDESAYIRGKYVADFESAYAAKTGAKHCISVANGTDALYIALKMLGIGAGDEVITTANSWIASSETITQTGARVAFADVEDAYYTLDPARVEAAITPRTKAVVVVHLLGQPAAMDPLVDLCRRHNLALVEDCAQAHFATFRGTQIGRFGRVATFSFYPGKNLGAYGDAGAIITDDEALADRMRCYARHGASPKDKHDHLMEGVNSRLDGLQAAILLAKLPHIDAWTKRRGEIAARYTARLAGVRGLVTPRVRDDATHVFHAYVIRSDRRDALQKHLTEQGVATAVHYPKPLPTLKAYEYLRHKPEDFPVAWRHHREILSLPLYPEMADATVDGVAALIRGFQGE